MKNFSGPRAARKRLSAQIAVLAIGLRHLVDAVIAVVSPVDPVVHQQCRQREGVAHRIDQPRLARVQRALAADVHVCTIASHSELNS